MKSDLVAFGRLRRRGKLLDEVIDTALNLLDVELCLIHARFEFVDAPHVGETLKKHIAQGSRCPLTEARTFERLDPVANRNDDIKVVKRNRTTSRLGSFVQNLHTTLLG